MPSSRLPLWALAAITIVPPLAISGYIALPYYHAYQEDVTPYTATYTSLSLPALETEKLPLRARELSLNRVKDVAKKENSIVEFRGRSTQKNKESVKNAMTEQDDQKSLDIDNLDLSGLSPELAARFESVLNEPSEYMGRNNAEDVSDSSYLELDKSGAQFAGRLPPLNFQTHNYTSKPSRRWVKVNGKEVTVGGNITPAINLLEINPRNVVIEFKGQKIEVPALYEWKG